jgi:hypothetical protein
MESSSAAGPSPRLLVEALMKELPDITKTITSRNGVENNNVVCHAWECPKGEECSLYPVQQSCVFSWPKKQGYQNPKEHLRSCLASGDVHALHLLYNQTIQRQGQSVTGFFAPVTGAITDREKAMHKWIEMIVMKNNPVSYVEDPLLPSATRGKRNGSMHRLEVEAT